MIHAMLLVAMTAAAGQAAQAPQTLACEARTPTGAVLTLEILPVTMKNEHVLFIGGGAGSPFPGAGKTFLAPFKQDVGPEAEYELGPRLVRLQRQGSIKNVTIFSSREGKIVQPIAFGHCVTGTASTSPTTQTSGDPFDYNQWQDKCFLTAPSPGAIRTSFTLNHKTEPSKNLIAEITPDDPSLWKGKLNIARQMLSPPPPAPKGVFMGVGRFGDAAATEGIVGMDVFYLDETARRASMIVRFNRFNGTSQPGFAICGITNLREGGR